MTKKLALLQLTLLSVGLAAGVAAAKSTPYASASSCFGDCGCVGGQLRCCQLANGALCLDQKLPD